MKKMITAVALFMALTACSTTNNISSSYKNASIYISENGIRVNAGLNYNIDY